MQPLPENAQVYPPPPPPPPPPQRSRKGLWIGLAIGVVVICLCCIVVIVAVLVFKIRVPGISNILASPTPNGLVYSNPSAGITLTYPATWLYSESGDASSGYMVLFASSSDILNNSSNAPQTGAALVLMTNVLATSDLSFPVDTSSMTPVVDYVATSYFSNISGGQDLRTFTISGFPAGSGVYTLSDSSGISSTAYLVAVLRDPEIILFFGVCSQSEWLQYQPVFTSMVNSAGIVTP